MHFFNGTYYLGDIREASLGGNFFSVLAITSLILLIYCTLRRCTSSKKWLSEEAALTVGLLITLAAPLFLMPGFRYLLPLMRTDAVILAFHHLDQTKRNLSIGMGVLIFSAGVSLFGSFKNSDDVFQFQTALKAKEMDHLLQSFEENNVEYAFCPNPMAQWQIMFYAREKTIVRYIVANDRYQEYVDRVNVAYNSGKTTALIVMKPEDFEHFNRKNLIMVTDHTALFLNPSTDKLSRFRFDTTGLTEDRKHH